MSLSRSELSILLSDLDRSVEDLRADYEDEAELVEAIATLGDELAIRAGADHAWVEDEVEQILARRGLIPVPQAEVES